MTGLSKADSRAWSLGGFFDELTLDHDLDFFADYHLAVQQHVERQAEFSSVDLALSAVTDPVAHPWVIELAILHH